MNNYESASPATISTLGTEKFRWIMRTQKADSTLTTVVTTKTIKHFQKKGNPTVQWLQQQTPK
jgi:hypothetical protein